MPTKDLRQSSGFLYHPQLIQQRQLISYICLSKNKRYSIRKWLLRQHLSNITFPLVNHYFSSSIFQVNKNPFFVFNPNNTCPSFSCFKDFLNLKLPLYILPQLPVLNINILLHFFNKRLYLNVRLIFLIITNNSIFYCQLALVATTRPNMRQLPNQRLMTYVRQITQLITLCFVNSASLLYANPTNQCHLRAFINTLKKKKYIKLIKNNLRIILRAFTWLWSIKSKRFNIWTKILISLT